MGRAISSLLLDLRPKMVEVMGLLPKVQCKHCCAQCPNSAAGHPEPRLRGRLLDTHSQVWVSFLWGHGSVFLGPGAHKVLSVSSKSLFLQSCISSVNKSHWHAKSNFLRFSVPLPDPQVGNSVVSPETFLTVWEFLWYNCSEVCGSSARLLYCEVNNDVLQEGLCHRLCDQVSCTQSPCPYGRPLLTRTSAGALKHCSGSVSLGLLG